MTRFDRYFLRQLLVLFCFFALILVSVFWISRSVSLFERLIGNGQSALVFFEFTALSLPTLVRTVMPMAAFGAAVYVTNRLTRESELTVMLATGTSPLRLGRPVFYFGCIVAIMMSAVTLYLRPASLERLDRREAEISRDLAAQLLRDGSFVHPVERVTFYIGEIEPDGTLRDVFISDRRDRGFPVDYAAQEAYLVWQDDQPNLVMLDGVAMRTDRSVNTLAVTHFNDFTYSIEDLTGGPGGVLPNIRRVPTRDLILDRATLAEAQGFARGEIVEELHQRFSWVMICLSVGMLGFSVLMVGGFSRFGLWPQVLSAFVALLLLEGLRGTASPLVERAPQLWWILYAPSVVGLALSYLCLRFAGRPLRAPSRRGGAGADAAPV